MLYHPDLAAALNEARTADLHHAAARGRHDAREGAASHTEKPPSVAYTWLDAYPRLCGLPVTIERLATNGAGRADAVVDQRRPALRDEGSTEAATKHWWRRTRPRLS